MALNQCGEFISFTTWTLLNLHFIEGGREEETGSSGVKMSAKITKASVQAEREKDNESNFGLS